MKIDTVNLHPNSHGQFGENNMMNINNVIAKENATNLECINAIKKKVFIVHGHDESMKYEVATFLGSKNLHPIILSDQRGKGRTIIEKFEEESSDAQFVIVLLSPDDFGGIIRDDKQQLKPRARQNVIFELGYFIGKLGRQKVCILVKKEVEIPSDILGLGYISFANNWKYDLEGELKDIQLI